MKIRLRENDYSDITFLSYRKDFVSDGEVLSSIQTKKNLDIVSINKILDGIEN